MLISLEPNTPSFNGRVAAQIWTDTGGRTIGRTRIRPANKLQRQRWEPPWTFAAARIAWGNLLTGVQDDWNDFADDNWCYPIQGSPRQVNGQTYFENFLTVERIKNPAAPIPDVPLALVEWQDRPKFFEIADWVGGTYTLKAETSFASGTELLFSGLPPTAVGFKPAFAQEKLIGTHTFELGLTENETTDVADTLMAAEFGPINSSLKIWGRIWETSDGFCRTIKDPCGPNPGAAPPAPATEFDFEVFNAYYENASLVSIDVYDSVYVLIGFNYNATPGAGLTETGTIELEDGYDVDDVASIQWWVDFDDGMMGFGEAENPTLDPFQFTVDSGF